MSVTTLPFHRPLNSNFHLLSLLSIILLFFNLLPFPNLLHVPALFLHSLCPSQARQYASQVAALKSQAATFTGPPLHAGAVMQRSHLPPHQSVVSSAYGHQQQGFALPTPPPQSQQEMVVAQHQHLAPAYPDLRNLVQMLSRKNEVRARPQKRKKTQRSCSGGFRLSVRSSSPFVIAALCCQALENELSRYGGKPPRIGVAANGFSDGSFDDDYDDDDDGGGGGGGGGGEARSRRRALPPAQQQRALNYHQAGNKGAVSGTSGGFGGGDLFRDACDATGDSPMVQLCTSLFFFLLVLPVRVRRSAKA